MWQSYHALGERLFMKPYEALSTPRGLLCNPDIMLWPVLTSPLLLGRDLSGT